MSVRPRQKCGLIYSPSSGLLAGWSHAQVPTSLLLSDGTIRVYFGARDSQNRTVPFYLELASFEQPQITQFCRSPVLPLGNLGCFDDCGVMPSCIVSAEDGLRLYYTGWNTSTSVPYRNAIGLAISDDGGRSFRRCFEGPILDRNALEPHFCATPFVLHDNSTWRMWYLSCTEWTYVGNRPEARYLIRYAESPDGINWLARGKIAIDYARPDEAIARPWVIKDANGYHMWYSFRSIQDYRTCPHNSYRLGYAASSDGLSWQRRDEEVYLPLSESGWDSEMVAYPAVVDIRGRRYLLYNGNGFGASGFGVAELVNASNSG